MNDIIKFFKLWKDIFISWGKTLLILTFTIISSVLFITCILLLFEPTVLIWYKFIIVIFIFILSTFLYAVLEFF